MTSNRKFSYLPYSIFIFTILEINKILFLLFYLLNHIFRNLINKDIYYRK